MEHETTKAQILKDIQQAQKDGRECFACQNESTFEVVLLIWNKEHTQATRYSYNPGRLITQGAR